jgi:hypothetical protein
VVPRENHNHGGGNPTGWMATVLTGSRVDLDTVDWASFDGSCSDESFGGLHAKENGVRWQEGGVGHGKKLVRHRLNEEQEAVVRALIDQAPTRSR